MIKASFCQCGKPVLTKGLCSVCYHKYLRERSDHLCQCGKPAVAKGLCSACYNRKKRENPEIRKRDRMSSKRYRLKIQQSMPKKPNMFMVPYTCSICHKEKKGFRRKTADGVVICPHCFKVLDEKKLIEERLKHRDESKKELVPFRDLLKDCNASGTCDIYALHHKLLINDPQRLTTEFLIKLTCGDKYTKYRQKKDTKKKNI